MKFKSVSKTNPKISVVMATYNGEAFIAEAINSILKQSFKDFEFIIVDDGSIDDTEQIVKSYKDDRVIYIKKKKNSGIADSLNKGLALAKGEYIARMDDDDVSYPHRFMTQLSEFEKNHHLILCASTAHNNDGEILGTNLNHESICLRLLFLNCIIHPTVMIKSHVLKQNLYDPGFVPSEDYELWSRLIKYGEFKVIETPLIHYRSHLGSITLKHRKKQLALNIPIANTVYEGLKLKKFENHNLNYSNFISHNYEISPIMLKDLTLWVKTFKEYNLEMVFFDETEFNTFLDNTLRRFTKSYFENNKMYVKIKALGLLPFKFKKHIILSYLFKNGL